MLQVNEKLNSPCWMNQHGIRIISVAGNGFRIFPISVKDKISLVNYATQLARNGISSVHTNRLEYIETSIAASPVSKL